jgi:hypothetical protein
MENDSATLHHLINSYSGNFDSQTRVLLRRLRQTETVAGKKSEFVDSGFVKKCDEHTIQDES